MAKGYLVDPFDKTITEVEVGDYKHIQDLIGCSCFTAAYLENGDVAYVDDEGLFKGPTDFILFKGYPQPLAGKAVVVGTDSEGNDIAPAISLDELKRTTDMGTLISINGAVAFVGDRTTRRVA